MSRLLLSGALTAARIIHLGDANTRNVLFRAADTARAIPARSAATSRTPSADSGLPRGEARRDVQGELELQAALSSRVAEQLLGLGEAITNRVVVDPEPRRAGAEVAAGVEEGFEGLAESADVVVSAARSPSSAATKSRQASTLALHKAASSTSSYRVTVSAS